MLSNAISAQVLLDADGQGNTYDLITSVLAPGNNPIEVPDCNHEAFGDHIDEVFDDELNQFVFRFHIHVAPDDDRCINFDRQRNEIKSYSPSPDNLLGVEGETVTYKWKFKLSEGFQSSPNFTHLHQLKSVGGSLASMPMYTLTTRAGNPDQLELRYAETTSQITLKKTDLTPFINTWVEVHERITYADLSEYQIEIKSVSTGEVLFSYSNDELVHWRPGAEFVRPKWGIYRSLLNAQDLRDETVLYANFSVQEGDQSAIIDEDGINEKFVLASNPVQGVAYIKNLPVGEKRIRLFELNGSRVLEHFVNETPNYELDVSVLQAGVYCLDVIGENFHQTELVIVLN